MPRIKSRKNYGQLTELYLQSRGLVRVKVSDSVGHDCTVHILKSEAERRRDGRPL